MAEIKWISIKTDIFDDEKILLIEALPEHDSIIVIWFKLLALAGKCNNNGVFMISDKIPYTDEMLATIFRRPLATVRLALEVFEKFGMIEYVNQVITIPNWEKHQQAAGMNRIREQTRKRVSEYRERQKQLALGMNEDTEVVEVVEEEEEEKPKKKTKKQIAEEEAEVLFEEIWAMYPRNKNDRKRSVSKTRKVELYKIGREKLEAAIKKYIAQQNPQYRHAGHRFFNEIIDNFIEDDVKRAPAKVEEDIQVTDEDLAAEGYC